LTSKAPDAKIGFPLSKEAGLKKTMALSLCLIMPSLLSQQVRPCSFSTCSNAACCYIIFNRFFVRYQASTVRHLLYSLGASSCSVQPSTCLRTYLSTCLLSGARGVLILLQKTNEFDQSLPQATTQFETSPTTFSTNRSLLGTELSEAFRFKTRATTT